MEIDDDWWRRDKSPHDDESWEDDEADTEETYPRCQACGEEIFDEDTVRCPSCGTYHSQEESPTSRQRGWVVLTAVVLVLLSLYWLARYSRTLF
jgi:ribosomal protein L37E